MRILADPFPVNFSPLKELLLYAGFKEKIKIVKMHLLVTFDHSLFLSSSHFFDNIALSSVKKQDARSSELITVPTVFQVCFGVSLFRATEFFLFVPSAGPF